MSVSRDASSDSSARSQAPLLIAFVDITGYTARANKTDDAVVAEQLNDYYGLVTRSIAAAGGHVVKFIGDAALIVFPEERVDDGVTALLALKDIVELWLEQVGWRGRLIVKAHFGTAIAGSYGPPGAERFDVLGANVNIAATVASDSFALTAEAFRKLAPETRKSFKKHTPPVTYIRSQDRHPHRTGRPR